MSLGAGDFAILAGTMAFAMAVIKFLDKLVDVSVQRRRNGKSTIAPDVCVNCRENVVNILQFCEKSAENIEKTALTLGEIRDIARELQLRDQLRDTGTFKVIPPPRGGGGKLP